MEAYLLHHSPGRAHREAGYAAPSDTEAIRSKNHARRAHAILTRPAGQAAIAHGTRRMVTAARHTQDDVIQLLDQVGFSDIRAAMEWDDDAS